MNEYAQIMQFAYGLQVAFVFAVITAFGGRPGGRLLKRVVAPLLFVLLLLPIKFNPWFLLAIPCYMVSASTGYGGDTWQEKLVRRSVWSLTRTACCLPFVIVNDAYVLLATQLAVGLTVTLILGILNPIEAPKEEGMINFASVMFVPIMT